MEIILAALTFILSIGGAICATVVPIAVFVGLGIFLYRRSKMRDTARAAAQTWSSTMGTVLMSNIKVTRTGNSRSETPVVIYQYQVNGKDFQGQTIKAGDQYFSVRVMGSAQDTISRYPIGAQVMVYYNPANPAESALER